MKKQLTLLLILILVCLTPMLMAAWDKDKPASSTSLRSSNPELLTNFSDLETALNLEHEFSTGGTTADQAHHRPGSARAFFQDAQPTTRADGATSFTSTDLGSLWFDTNATPDNLAYVLTATTPTWTLKSTSTIAEMVAATHTWALAQTFSVAPTWTLGAAANNTYLTATDAAGTGTVDLIKADANDVAVVPNDSQTATNAAPTQTKALTNKKYVDDHTTMVPAVTGAGTGYAGGESITFANGLTLKQGVISSPAAGDSTEVVTFAANFSTAILNIQLTFRQAGTIDDVVFCYVTGTPAVSGFSVYINDNAAQTAIYWQAWGY